MFWCSLTITVNILRRHTTALSEAAEAAETAPREVASLSLYLLISFTKHSRAFLIHELLVDSARVAETHIHLSSWICAATSLQMSSAKAEMASVMCAMSIHLTMDEHSRRISGPELGRMQSTLEAMPTAVSMASTANSRGPLRDEEEEEAESRSSTQRLSSCDDFSLATDWIYRARRER